MSYHVRFAQFWLVFPLAGEVQSDNKKKEKHQMKKTIPWKWFGGAVKALAAAAMALALSCTAWAETWTDGETGYTWSYQLVGDKAVVMGDGYSAAVTPAPAGFLAVPAKIGGVSLGEIGANAFFDCPGMTGVSIPDGVTAIRDGAFSDCTGLKSIVIPSGVTWIGDMVFDCCTSLKSVTFAGDIPEHVGADIYQSTPQSLVTTVPATASGWSGAVAAGTWQGRAIYGTGTATVGKYTWAYRIVNGGAEIFYDNGYGGDVAVSPKPTGAVVVPDVLGGKIVRSIGSNAFRDCDNMTSVAIVEGTTNISSYAFYDCDNLESVDICTPDGTVHRIGDSAFSCCENLATVTLPKHLYSIGSFAFAYTAIESITIPANVTNIGSQAFAACGNLASVRYLGNCPAADKIYNNAAEGVQSIVTEGTTGWDAALEAGTWQDRDIIAVLPTENDGNGHTWTYRIIGNEAQICNNGAIAVNPLPNGYLVIPSTLGGKPVTGIGAHAFEQCDGLTQVFIPSSVTNIEEYAFDECVALKNVTIPDGVQSIGECAFFGCASLETATLPKNLKVIGPSAFDSCEKLTGVTIPDGVTTIGAAAFYWCTSITSLTIPASVKTIGYAAFSCCEKLKTVTYLGACPTTTTGDDLYDGTPDDLVSVVTEGMAGWDEAIESGTWQDRGVRVKLSEWTDGNGYTWTYHIKGDEAEICNNGARAVSPEPTGDVTIPSTLGGKPVTKIGASAFSYCNKMTKVTIPASVKTIEDYAFSMCSGLADQNGFVIVRNVLHGYYGAAVDVTVPAGVTRIGGGAFQRRSAMMGKPSLTRVTLPASVTGIGVGAFFCCTELESVTRLDEIDDIGEGAFLYCFKMADAEGFVIVRNVLHGYYGHATDLTVPEGVTRIGTQAFMNELGCALQHVTIPKSVTEIGNNAFKLCNFLKTVTYLCDCPTVGEEIYTDTPAELESLVSPYVQGWDAALNAGTWQDRAIRVDETIPEPHPVMHTVTFDANGGTADLLDIDVEEGATIWEFPTATREGYTLDGWWTAKSGGTKVTPETVVTQDMMVYAHWKENGGGGESGGDGDGGGEGEGGDGEGEGGEGDGEGGAPVDPEPGVEPVPCYEFLDITDITEPYSAPSAVVLHGAVYDGCDVVGIVELKLGKAKKMSSKIGGSVTLLNGKKYTIKAQAAPVDGKSPTVGYFPVKSLGTMHVAIGGTKFAGSLGDWHVQSASVCMAWSGKSATAAVEMDDVSVFSGKVLTGLLPYSEVADVNNGKWKFKKAAGVKWGKPKKGAVPSEFYDPQSGKDLLVDDTKGKTNLSGMKLSYTPKKGTFKGSFKLYSLQGSGKKTKLKKYTVKVSGVVVDGVGYGIATCKKPAMTWAVTVTK